MPNYFSKVLLFITISKYLLRQIVDVPLISLSIPLAPSSPPPPQDSVTQVSSPALCSLWAPPLPSFPLALCDPGLALDGVRRSWPLCCVGAAFGAGGVVGSRRRQREDGRPLGDGDGAGGGRRRATVLRVRGGEGRGGEAFGGRGGLGRATGQRGGGRKRPWTCFSATGECGRLGTHLEILMAKSEKVSSVTRVLIVILCSVVIEYPQSSWFAFSVWPNTMCHREKVEQASKHILYWGILSWWLK